MSKKCPFCAELIHKDAIKCKHCGSNLSEIDNKNQKEKREIPELNQKAINERNKKAILWILGIILAIWLWYLAIPALIIWFIWKKINLDKKKKWIATGLTVCIYCIILTITAYTGRTPNIIIIEPKNNFSVQADNITIKGSVKPKYSKVTVNRSSEPSIDKNGNFTYTAKLDEEKNQFVFTATNNKNKKEVSVSVNRIFTEEEKVAKAEAKKKADEEKAQKEAETKAQAEAKAEAEKELDAEVRFSDVAFMIKNKETKNWTNCKFVLNGKVFGSDYTYKTTAGIVANDSVIVAMRDFTKGDGTRFDPYSTKAKNLFLSCDVGDNHRTGYFTISE